MRRYGLIMLILCQFLILIVYGKNTLTGKKVRKYPFYVYTEYKSKLNYFAPSGFMGDIQDISLLTYQSLDSPKKGKTCIKVEYTARNKTGARWAGVYWQNPPKNWGNKKGGYDLSGAKMLYFYARGKTGNEIVEFKFGGISGKFPDSASASTGLIELTKNWKLYEIDLADLNLAYIIGGFCVVFLNQLNPDGCVIYLDEIYFNNLDMPVELSSLFVKYDVVKEQIKIAVMDFKNKSKSKNFNYLAKTIPNIISAYFLKKGNLVLIDSNKLDDIINNIPPEIEKSYALNEEIILYKILQVDVIIEGDFEKISNEEIRINLTVKDKKNNSIIISDQIQGHIDKAIFLKLDEVSQNIFHSISNIIMN